MSLRPLLRLKDYLTPGACYHFATVDIDRTGFDHCHRHDFFEIFWIEKGKGFHLINGTARPLTPGTVFFVCPDDFHDFRTERGQTLRLANAAFPRTDCLSLAKRHAGLAKWFSGSPTGREIPAGVIDRSFLEACSAGLLLGQGELLARDRFLLNLIFELEHRRAPAVLAPDWLEKTLRQSADPALFREGTKAFYRQAGRSAEHVIRETRRCTGLTPTALLTRERMRYAGEQLATTNRTISDISADCGLENLSHFYRTFRSHHGCAPRQFRLRHQRLAQGRPVEG